VSITTSTGNRKKRKKSLKRLLAVDVSLPSLVILPEDDKVKREEDAVIA
jgi:hypothetical protein